jgi:outer membrane biosynthesis protein TonB
VAFTVQPDGTVAEPRVLSTSHPRLAQTATATVLQWRFRPLRHAQDAVVDLGFDMD